MQALDASCPGLFDALDLPWPGGFQYSNLVRSFRLTKHREIYIFGESCLYYEIKAFKKGLSMRLPWQWVRATNEGNERRSKTDFPRTAHSVCANDVHILLWQHAIMSDYNVVSSRSNSQSCFANISIGHCKSIKTITSRSTPGLNGTWHKNALQFAIKLYRI